MTQKNQLAFHLSTLVVSTTPTSLLQLKLVNELAESIEMKVSFTQFYFLSKTDFINV